MSEKPAKPFSLLIKPASADCNLNCAYCFYLEKCELYSESARHRMSEVVLERLVESYMKTDQPVYSFGWQGGEPTLMGLSFFRQVIALQQKHGRPGVSVANGLQTNATLIDGPLAEHLARYRFLVGCSLDGPADVHNRYRQNRSGQPSYSMVQTGLSHLKQAGASINILTLVSRANVERAADVYHHLLAGGYTFHQYIPCVEFDDDGNLLPFSITGEEWGRFLCELFDLWYLRDIRRVSIRHFDAILSKIVDNTDTVCTIGSNCCQYFLVEYNGDIYPCDFFADRQWKLGNIMSASWEELSNSPLYQRFGEQKGRWHTRCSTCDCLDLCSGDCLKHRLYAGNVSDNLSFLCEGWQQFIRYSRERFNRIAAEIVADRRQAQAVKEADPPGSTRKRRPGRNAPCPCGSGLKYKKCCGRHA